MKEILLRLYNLERNRQYRTYNIGNILDIYDKNTDELIKTIKYDQSWTDDDISQLVATTNKYLG